MQMLDFIFSLCSRMHYATILLLVLSACVAFCLNVCGKTIFMSTFKYHLYVCVNG